VDPEDGGNLQYAVGNYIAQAAPGGTAIVVSYQFAPPAPVSPDTLAAALACLGGMPVDVDRPANVGSVTSASRLPFSANPFFTGRDAALKATARALREPAPPGLVPAVAVTGIGGVGKTQLAIEFAHRYGPFFAGGVCWVSFAESAAIPAEVAACGGVGALDLRPDFAALPLEDQVRLVMSAWRSDLPRLLVFDTCEDEAELARWRPPGGGSRVLVTARRDRWDPMLNVTVVPLDTLDREGSVTLLRKYRPDLPAADAGLSRVAAELDGLPLALHLAGSFLARYRAAITSERYAADLARPGLLAHRSLEGSGISPTGHVQSVARTFALSYERLDAGTRGDALALMLLSRACRFAPGEQIPRSLLLATLHADADSRDDDLDALLAAEDALSRSVELGLLEAPNPETVRMHRLVAAFVLGTGDDVKAQVAVESALLARYELRRRDSGLRGAGELLPHMRIVTDASLGRPDEQAYRLSDLLGNHLREIGAYTDACGYLATALEIAEEIAGAGHPKIARPLNDLGFALFRAGRIDEALQLLRRAVPLWQQLGDEENLAATLDNIGQLVLPRDLREAAEYFNAALEIRKRVLGMGHPRTGITLHNLGTVATRLGDIRAAEWYFEASLTAKGEEPTPSLAATHMELAYLHSSQGDYASSHSHFVQAAEIYEQTLGSGHHHSITAQIVAAITDPSLVTAIGPSLADRLARAVDGPSQDTGMGATTLNNLGLSLWLRGEDSAAAILYRKALRVYETTESTESPATVLNNLAMVAQRRHDYSEALELFERAQAMLEESGEDPYLLARVRNNMGLLLSQTGKVALARDMLGRSLEARLALLGEDSPDTAITQVNLALTEAPEGDSRAARRQIERALAIVERAIGRASPQAARIRRDLGTLLRSAGNPGEALDQLQQALAIQRASLPPRHPDLIETLEALGLQAKELGRLEEATRFFAEAREITEFRFGSDALAQGNYEGQEVGHRDLGSGAPGQ
jgi:tetratricopeptide (TPR) repeat protein